jgi:HK97 family phage major capsid protein
MANHFIERQITAWRKIKNDMTRIEAQHNYEKAQAIRRPAEITSVAPPRNESFVYVPDRPGAHGTATNRYEAEILHGISTNFAAENPILEEGSDSQGGYLVPDSWDSRLIQKLADKNEFRKYATVEQTKGKRRYPTAASQPSGAWVSEGGDIPFTDMTFGEHVLDPHKLAVAIKVSEELMFDSEFDIQNYITLSFASQLATAEESAFLTGAGNGMPTGIFNPASGANIITSAHSELSADDIYRLVDSIKRPYRKNARFIMSDSVLKQIDLLKQFDGEPLWRRDFHSDAPDTILGFPMYITDNAPAYAPGAAVIAFGDFSAYHIADCERRTITRLDEAYATEGMVGFIGRERVDGKLLLPEAVSVLKLAE